MIYCPSCGTANRDGSRFCNECGTKLPTLTSSLCPTCGTPNPPNSLFCEKCGARLIALLPEKPKGPEAPAPASPVPKGLSLPTKSPAEVEPAAAAQGAVEAQKPAESAQSAEEELPEWMQALQSAAAGASESDIATGMTASGASDQAAPEEEIPDWLKTLGTTGQVPSGEEIPATSAPAAAEETPPWAAHLGSSAELPAEEEEEESPERLKEPPSPYFSTAPSETPPPPPPSAPQVQPAAEEMPDWLRDLRPAAGAEEALPDWLDELGVEEQPAPESIALSTGDSALDWLSQLGATAPEPPGDQGAAPAAETPAWLSGAGEGAQPQEPAIASDWMSSLRAAAPQVDAQPAEEMPDWLRELEVEQPPLETAAAGETPDWMTSLRAASIEPEATAEEEGAPDWLKGAGLAAAGAAAVSAHEEENPPEPAAPQKPVTDWLAALRQAAPVMEAEQASAEETPEWMREESGVAPEAIGGPGAYDQEVPDWLREPGAVADQPAAQAAEETPEQLREPGVAPASAEAQPPPQPEEGVPNWLKGLGAAAAVGALAGEQKPEDIAPQKPVTDWLAALRQATPAMEAEQASAEEAPEWMREESGVAPEAIGGPEAYDQEVPDWLREPGAAPASAEAQPPSQPEEEGVPDWLKGLGAAAAVGALAGEQKPEDITPQKPVTDWLAALRQATPAMEAEQASAEEMPEWMREESGVAPEAIGGPAAYDQEVPDWLREESSAAIETAQPPAAAPVGEEEGVPDWLKALGGAAAVSAAEPRAEAPADEGLPDWLRELTPTAAAAEPKVEEPEEIAQPEVTAEAEPETESRESKAAPIAAAGLAAAAVAAAATRSEKADAGPAEMPEWLKEIHQEQQAAKTTIPVPPPEAGDLTQTEIPEWLEALRPKEEAAAPQAAETHSETEGPLAGIANALPPAPIMGEMHGLSPKLQFAVSAEDQARAGVLKELLTQHAVAPAAVEQFVVKGSGIRRRALRWIVAFLIITALFVPLGIDLNQLTGLPLMPNAQKMVPLPAVRSAAYEISRVAQLPPDSKVLVVFDYDATQAGELDHVAAALLESPALRNAQLEVASLNPQGSAMAQSVLKNLPDLRYTDLGFAPGQANGVQSLLAKAGDVKLIIEVAASPETVRWWAEQLRANRAEIPLVVGVSAGAEPLTMPYVQSGQVKGLVSGFPGAVVYLNATGVMNTLDPQDRLDNYQAPLDALALANYVMVALIIVGLMAALLRGAGRRSA